MTRGRAEAIGIPNEVEPDAAASPAGDGPRPSLGRIVLFTLGEGEDAVNSARIFPAVITMVHGGGLVNLRVFCDAEPGMRGERRTSVEQADRPGEPCTWCWPPRA